MLLVPGAGRRVEFDSEVGDEAGHRHVMANQDQDGCNLPWRERGGERRVRHANVGHALIDEGQDGGERTEGAGSVAGLDRGDLRFGPTGLACFTDSGSPQAACNPLPQPAMSRSSRSRSCQYNANSGGGSGSGTRCNSRGRCPAAWVARRFGTVATRSVRATTDATAKKLGCQSDTLRTSPWAASASSMAAAYIVSSRISACTCCIST